MSLRLPMNQNRALVICWTCWRLGFYPDPVQILFWVFQWEQYSLKFLSFVLDFVDEWFKVFVIEVIVHLRLRGSTVSLILWDSWCISSTIFVRIDGLFFLYIDYNISMGSWNVVLFIGLLSDGPMMGEGTWGTSRLLVLLWLFGRRVGLACF